MIGKGAERSARVLFYTFNIVKLVGFILLRACIKWKTVKIIIGRWWGGESMNESKSCSEK